MSAPAGENTNEGDDVIQRQEGLAVLVSLAAARIAESLGRHLRVRCPSLVDGVSAARFRPERAGWGGGAAARGGRLGREAVRVRRDLCRLQGHSLDASGRTQQVRRKSGPLAEMDRDPALKVGKREGGLAIAAISGPEQREKRRVLCDGQKLSIAKCPTLGREIESHQGDLTDKRVLHGASPREFVEVFN